MTAGSRHIDENSSTWRAVKDCATHRLDRSRDAVETHGIEPAVTEFERGRIAFAKEVLRLAEKKENTAGFA